MSNYNKYAKELDNAFKAARDKYIEAYNEVEVSKAALSVANENRPAEPYYITQARKADAELRNAQAAGNFEKTSREVWAEFKKTVEELRAELNKAISGDSLANPDAVDANALKLLESGIMSVDDVESFADRYDNNATMLKLISKYAHDMASKSDGENRQRLNILATNTAEGLAGKVIEFDKMIDSAMVFSGQTRRDNTPDFIVSMLNKWDSVGEWVENF